MGMGAANVFIKEYDLSEIVPSFKGVIGAIVLDSEKGKVNEQFLVTTEKQLIENYGKPLPKKYGLGIYSALNFLANSDQLWAVRVDKGQTYASLLVRSEIDPISEYDIYGYILEKPVVDPIVKPLGPLAKEDIDNYQFNQYEAVRVVESFAPVIALLDPPSPNDTIFNVTSNAVINIGDIISFVDTTGMTREQTLNYSTYTVTDKETVVVDYDYIVVDGDQSEALNSVVYDSEVTDGSGDSFIPNIKFRSFEYDADSDKTSIKVSTNDPITETENVTINSQVYVVETKHQLANNVNTITVDTAYAAETSLSVGSEIFNITNSDFEFHDAFLVSASTPGEWGNKLAVAIRDSANYQNAFWLDVYFEGQLVESFEVTRSHEHDGFGRQLFIEDKVNSQSRYIKVKNNEFMVDENDQMVEPLKTLSYLRQKAKTPIYSIVTQTVETVWDGDSSIRVDSIANIDVEKPIQLGNNIYNIGSIGSSTEGGSVDTIFLESNVALGLDNLLPNERKLDIGADVKQYFDSTQEVTITIVNTDAENLVIVITGTSDIPYTKTYTVAVAGTETTTEIATSVVAAINNGDGDLIVIASESTPADEVVNLTSKVSGVGFTVTVTGSVNGAITPVNITENTRQFEISKSERIVNTILPTVLIDSVIAINNVSYSIRDAGANSMIGGDDAGYPTIGQYILAADSLANKEDVDFLVLMDGGITAKAYQQKLVEIATNRQDCFVFLSPDFDAQANPDINAGLVAYRNDMNINSSYAALYSHWIKIYDKYNDFEIWASPESWAARAASWVSSNRELWYALAGWNHAKIMALNVYRKCTQGERNILYDNQINPIKIVPGKGLVIWGQKTLQVKPSALDRINVRMLLIVIERGLRDFLDGIVFQFNDTSTRSSITSNINAFLQDIKVRRGLYDFNVVCDGSNNSQVIIDRNELYVDVYLQPVKVAEYITARVVITRTGANYNEVAL